LYSGIATTQLGLAGCSTNGEAASVSQDEETQIAAQTKTYSSLAVDDLEAGTAWSDVDTGHRSRMVSHQDEDIYVSVNNGDDQNGGRSKNDAYKTINKALSEVPKFCYHSISIHIDYGDYRSQDGPRIFHIHQTARSRTGDSVAGTPKNNPFTGGGLKIWGHVEYNDYYDSTKTAEDIVFSYGLDSGCGGSEELTVWGITIDGWWQSYDSSIRFRNCVFKNGDRDLIGGHRCRAQMWGCTFKNAKMIGHIGGMGFVTFQGDCKVQNIDQPFKLWGGSIVYLHDINHNLITDPPNDSVTKNGAGWIMNHPEGNVQENGGTPLSRGKHTFGDSAILTDTEGNGHDVVLENQNGELVAIIDGTETTLA
jgi:hypothetical protein